MIKRLLVLALAAVFPMSLNGGFDLDTSPQPATHPPLRPADGAVVIQNPPPLIWRVQERAVSYILEMAPTRAFDEGLIRVRGIDLPFYNHTEPLEEGTWYWRFYAVDAEGWVSRPSARQSFVVPDDAVKMPLPNLPDLLAGMPEHPRIFVTPDTLDEFRARRDGPGAEAWAEIEWRAERAIRVPLPEPDLVSMEQELPTGQTPRSNSWREGQPTRRQAFFLHNGEIKWARNLDFTDLNAAANNAQLLSYAYLISGDKQYAEAAKPWLLFLSDARVDAHISHRDRAAHDTVVYAYEMGLRDTAVTYDRLHARLSPEERRRVVEHIEYHGDATYRYLRERVNIHLAFQQSHPQQAMHPLLTTALAVATESDQAAEWLWYMVRQYVNRIAWTSPDGGYFEGQTYGHKFRWILEAMIALRTATGIDAFTKPEIRNSGDFWLYCMALNYWFHHGGDVYSLIWPWGNPADAYITNLMAAMNEDPYVQWWSDTVFADPAHIPFQYLSDTGLTPRPPIDIEPGKLFPYTGQLAMHDRFWDHGTARLFFRSSPWGAHSHAHADQNNFVIHANGEILAADTGYYTYYNDVYHSQWTWTTNTHNSILVNGEGQPKSIEAKGKITRFFQSPAYAFFTGDASEAYEEPLETFRRSILYLRPDLFVVFDELKASEPAVFSWLLNTFSGPEIDEDGAVMTVAQQHMRMDVRHLAPAGLSYESSNERRFPMLTRAWTRFSEAFPEPWHTRVNTPASAETPILALLHTYSENGGPRTSDVEKLGNDGAIGLRFLESGVEERIVFRKREDGGNPDLGGLRVEGHAAAAGVDREGALKRYLLIDGVSLRHQGRLLAELPGEGNVSVAFGEAAAAAIARVDGGEPGALRLALRERPDRLWLAPPMKPGKGRAVPFVWDHGMAEIEWPGGDYVLWVDPVFDPRAETPRVTLTVQDAEGVFTRELKTAMADNGDLVAFGQLDPLNPGMYRFHNDVAGEWLVQDRWDPALSRRGGDATEAFWRSGEELYFRFAPGGEVPELHAELVESKRGTLINLIRNGGFEEGLLGYPPRGWTVTRARTDDVGWPEWSQEDSYAGESALKFTRPRDSISTESQPFRLREPGVYRLRFQAKGNATHASVAVRHSRGGFGATDIEPSEEWRLYERDVEIPSGYTQISIRMAPGGEPNQVVWVDEVEFGLKPE